MSQERWQYRNSSEIYLELLQIRQQAITRPPLFSKFSSLLLLSVPIPFRFPVTDSKLHTCRSRIFHDTLDKLIFAIFQKRLTSCAPPVCNHFDAMSKIYSLSNSYCNTVIFYFKLKTFQIVKPAIACNLNIILRQQPFKLKRSEGKAIQFKL